MKKIREACSNSNFDKVKELLKNNDKARGQGSQLLRSAMTSKNTKLAQYLY